MSSNGCFLFQQGEGPRSEDAQYINVKIVQHHGPWIMPVTGDMWQTVSIVSGLGWISGSGRTVYRVACAPWYKYVRCASPR